MKIADRLAALLPADAARLLVERQGITQVRLRAGRPVQLVGDGWEALSSGPLEPDALRDLLSALMEFSVYARQDELDRGFFTLEDGSRVGVCGRMFLEDGRARMGEIGSACVRVARELPGCADALMEHIVENGRVRSTLLISPPGMGKTTLLRDIARQLSDMGKCVGVADERHELAACRRGIPALNVGDRADVMDGCPRPQAIRRLLRSMAPEVIVADEIGGAEDARAIEDAARCGVAVVASAHADGIGDMLSRECLRTVACSGAMNRAVLLGSRPGRVRGAWRRETGEEGSAWRPV